MDALPFRRPLGLSQVEGSLLCFCHPTGERDHHRFFSSVFTFLFVVEMQKAG